MALRPNESTDWDAIRTQAVSGDLSSVPSDVYIRCYNQLRRIGVDHMQPIAVERTCNVYWGTTGTGKSRRAWNEASFTVYSKDPRTKWWCGYTSQKHVVMDEFLGDIGIAHMLRWLDRYPVSVETKGGAVPLAAETIWITSNLNPDDWYPDIDADTKAALRRRLNITHFQ